MRFRDKKIISFVLVLVSLGCVMSPASTPTLTPIPIIKNYLPTPANTPSTIPSVSPTQTSTAEQKFQIEIKYQFSENLITGLYHLYGKRLGHLARITLINRQSSAVKLRAQTEVIGYTTPSVETVILAAGEQAQINQNPNLLPDVVDRLANGKPATLQLRITQLKETGEVEILNQTKNIYIYARRDFPWRIDGITNEQVGNFLAAWVTPGDLSVEALIRNAADYHPDRAMISGYSYDLDDEDNDVRDRIEALWKAVNSRYKVIYISTPVSFAPGSVQRIRFPSEVLDQRSGNCIELVLLFSSALEALELQTEIKLIPGHAYLGVRTGEKSDKWYFIETTMVGDSTFRQAWERGTEEYNRDKPKFVARADEYDTVVILSARKDGILPIPWR